MNKIENDILTAARSQDNKKLKWLLKKPNATVSFTDDQGKSPLDHAIAGGSETGLFLDTMSLLLTHVSMKNSSNKDVIMQVINKALATAFAKKNWQAIRAIYAMDKRLVQTNESLIRAVIAKNRNIYTTLAISWLRGASLTHHKAREVCRDLSGWLLEINPEDAQDIQKRLQKLMLFVKMILNSKMVSNKSKTLEITNAFTWALQELKKGPAGKSTNHLIQTLKKMDHLAPWPGMLAEQIQVFVQDPSVDLESQKRLASQAIEVLKTAQSEAVSTTIIHTGQIELDYFKIYKVPSPSLQCLIEGYDDDLCWPSQDIGSYHYDPMTLPSCEQSDLDAYCSLLHDHVKANRKDIVDALLQFTDEHGHTLVDKVDLCGNQETYIRSLRDQTEDHASISSSKIGLFNMNTIGWGMVTCVAALSAIILIIHRGQTDNAVYVPQ